MLVTTLTNITCYKNPQNVSHLKYLRRFKVTAVSSISTIIGLGWRGCKFFPIPLDRQGSVELRVVAERLEVNLRSQNSRNNTKKGLVYSRSDYIAGWWGLIMGFSWIPSRDWCGSNVIKVSPGLLLKAAILAKKNSKIQTSSLQLKQTYKNNPTTIHKKNQNKK